MCVCVCVCVYYMDECSRLPNRLLWFMIMRFMIPCAFPHKHLMSLRPWIWMKQENFLITALKQIVFQGLFSLGAIRENITSSLPTQFLCFHYMFLYLSFNIPKSSQFLTLSISLSYLFSTMFSCSLFLSLIYSYSSLSFFNNPSCSVSFKKKSSYIHNHTQTHTHIYLHTQILLPQSCSLFLSIRQCGMWQAWSVHPSP